MTDVITLEIVWRGVCIEVRQETNWLNSGLHHIETEAKPRTPLPITQTGYRSAFVADDVLAEYADAATYVRQWLDAEAAGWDGQLALF